MDTTVSVAESPAGGAASEDELDDAAASHANRCLSDLVGRGRLRLRKRGGGLSRVGDAQGGLAASECDARGGAKSLRLHRHLAQPAARGAEYEAGDPCAAGEARADPDPAGLARIGIEQTRLVAWVGPQPQLEAGDLRRHRVHRARERPVAERSDY